MSINEKREESSHLLDCTLSNWIWTSLTFLCWQRFASAQMPATG